MLTIGLAGQSFKIQYIYNQEILSNQQRNLSGVSQAIHGFYDHQAAWAIPGKIQTGGFEDILF